MDVHQLIDSRQIKRYLSARNKIIYPNAVYHVTHRAPGRELLFVEESDFLHMLSLFKSNAKEFLWDIYAFDVEIQAGRRKQITVRIPPTIISEEEKKEAAVSGTLRISSTPSNAEIYIDGTNTGLLTPETFKELTPGRHELFLRSFSRRLKIWDEYKFDIEIVKGEKLELKVNIPGELILSPK